MLLHAMVQSTRTKRMMMCGGSVEWIGARVTQLRDLQTTNGGFSVSSRFNRNRFTNEKNARGTRKRFDFFELFSNPC